MQYEALRYVYSTLAVSNYRLSEECKKFQMNITFMQKCILKYEA